MNNTFSVITVVKNNPQGLEKTLNSVFSQNYPHIQSIVIDGNSQDETLQIAKQFDKIDILVSEEDKGIYDAMNKGISYAKGDWTIFLNADDIFDNNTVLSDIHNLILVHPHASIICGHTKEILYDQEIIRYTKDISCLPIHMPACHQSMLIHTALLKNNLFDTSYKICGDLEQISKIVHSQPIIIYFPHCISKIQGIGLSNTQWRLTKNERCRVQQQYYPSQRKRLRSYHQALTMKKGLRSLLPIKVQLIIRLYINKKK